MIPKIIHYCWLSGDPIPENLQRCMDSWKVRLPDYEFVLWNFGRFDKESSQWVSQAFDSKKYAFAADYIRLYAVYHYGGIYLDMDIEALRSFDDLLDADVMLAYENDERSGIEAGCFGAEKENPFIGACLDYYEGRSFIKADGSFDTLPLPKIMMRISEKYPLLDIRDRLTFTCKSYQTGKIDTNEHSYAIHHFAGSWTSHAQKTYDRQRMFLTSHFGVVGKLIAIFPFCLWQIRDNGVRCFVKKLRTRIHRNP